MISNEYVEERGGDSYVVGSRVSLASVIYAFREGASPETIPEDFRSLSLDKVYGAIAFYLKQPEESESYLQRLSEEWKETEQSGQKPGAEMQKRLAAVRERLAGGYKLSCLRNAWCTMRGLFRRAAELKSSAGFCPGRMRD